MSPECLNNYQDFSTTIVVFVPSFLLEWIFSLMWNRPFQLRRENMSSITHMMLFISVDFIQARFDNHFIFCRTEKKNHPVSSSLQHTRAFVYLFETHANNCNINRNYKMVVRVTVVYSLGLLLNTRASAITTLTPGWKTPLAILYLPQY